MSGHFQGSHHASSHFTSSHFGREIIVELPPEDVHPPGMGRISPAWIKEEDEVIMAIIVAFLEMKGH